MASLLVAGSRRLVIKANWNVDGNEHATRVKRGHPGAQVMNKVERTHREIQVGLGSQTQGILDTDDPYLFAGRADQPHLRDADTLIDSWLANVKAPVFVMGVPPAK